ncbi:TPA: hypothetical protein DDW35_09665 [Candidatus Sumerlaeota bacterium]|nr:hypothetical protein [Candidatus Sumerlaeota bacterium]
MLGECLIYVLQIYWISFWAGMRWRLAAMTILKAPENAIFAQEVKNMTKTPSTLHVETVADFSRAFRVFCGYPVAWL